MFTRAKVVRLPALAAMALLVTFGGSANAGSKDGVIRVKSAYSFTDTIAQIGRAHV